MDTVKEILTCKYCMEIYKSTPIILNCCSETICKNHIDEFRDKESDNNDSFVCRLCHTKSHQNAFPVNKIADKFVKMNIQKLEFGDKYNKPKNSCKNLEQLVKEFECIIKDPRNFIYEQISKVKFDIDLKREELKEKIDKISNQMIDKVVQYEKQCYENLSLDSLRINMIDFIGDVEKIKSKLHDWHHELDMLVIDNSKWENIRSKSIIQYNQLESLMNEFKNDLMLNKVCTFNKSLDALNQLEKDLTIKERYFSKYLKKNY